MKIEFPTPKVVISDKEPPALHCRNEVERAACHQLLSIIRQGKDPVAFITRKINTGEIEVDARSSTFASVQDVMKIFEEAKAKLLYTLFRKRIPMRTS